MNTNNRNEARPFRRIRDNRILGGVSGAIAERLDVDTNTIPIALVVVAVLGGGGALLYAAGWLLILDEVADASIAENFARTSLGADWASQSTYEVNEFCRHSTHKGAST
jgi:phage shock protein PspC (stress-responsive transcriptional regulator)